MCNFLSAIALKNLDVIWDYKCPDNHEQLIKKYNLKGSKSNCFNEAFCKVEFSMISPQNNDLKPNDIGNWRVNLGGDVPDWFDKEIITNKLWAIISNMFVQGEKELLEKGCFILLDTALVEEVRSCRIQYMLGKSVIKNLRENSTVENMRNLSFIKTIWDNSSISSMEGNSMVGNMRDYSKIKNIRNYSIINSLYKYTTIENLYENSTVGNMYEYSLIKNIWNNSKVFTMLDNSVIHHLWDNSEIKNMEDNSMIVNMHNNSKIYNMRKDFKVKNDYRPK
jgi:cobyrinic acid a,c-diamide synthase